MIVIEILYNAGADLKGSMEKPPIFDRPLTSLNKLLSISVTQSFTTRFYNKTFTFTSFYCKIIGNYVILHLIHNKRL